MTTDGLESQLRAALSSQAAQVPSSALSKVRGRQYRFGLMPPAAVLTAVAAAIAAAIGWGAYLATPSGTDQVASRPASTGSASTPARSGSQDLYLAGYRFAAPADFSLVQKPCGSTPNYPYIPITSAAYAQSRTGACVAAALVDGRFRPAASKPLTIGSYGGYLSSQGDAVVLVVNIPAATAMHSLMLTTHGLPASTVIEIARSGLPAHPGPPPTCSGPCG